MTEQNIQGQILEYLNLRNIIAWKNQTGTPGGRYRIGRSGAPDIVGIMPDGRFLGIEVKKPGEPLSEGQEKFLNDATARGAFVISAYSVACVAEALIKDRRK